MTWPRPGPLFNPITAWPPLTPAEVFAGPLGILALFPLIPLMILLARRHPRAAIVGISLLWVLATAGPWSTLVVLVAVMAQIGWVVLLQNARRRGMLSSAGMIALVWLGLHGMLLWVWWNPTASWYGWVPARMPVLHSLGLSYLLLRSVAWGVDVAKDRCAVGGFRDNLCWLLYAPCMRLGPVVRQPQFLQALASWRPKLKGDFSAGLRRLGWGMLGLLGLGWAVAATPHAPAGQTDFFSSPEVFSTERLVRLIFLIPIQTYFFMWSYCELAAAAGLWIGLPVGDNFDHLPRATSVRDFWRRWNITVGAWLRDYVYIPLGGSRGLVFVHVAAVFAYCAVWHGPSWSFVVWAASQALAIWVETRWHVWRVNRNIQLGRAWTVVAWLLTMAYQIVTIFVFADFQYSGSRVFSELLRRTGLF